MESGDGTLLRLSAIAAASGFVLTVSRKKGRSGAWMAMEIFHAAPFML